MLVWHGFLLFEIYIQPCVQLEWPTGLIRHGGQVVEVALIPPVWVGGGKVVVAPPVCMSRFWWLSIARVVLPVYFHLITAGRASAPRC